jgi:hypothetical protein
MEAIMKIAESTLLPQSGSSQQVQSSKPLHVPVDRPAAAANVTEQASFQVDISIEARQMLSSEAAAIEENEASQNVTPEMKLIRSLIEMLIRLFDHDPLPTPDPNAPVTAQPDPNAVIPAKPGPAAADSMQGSGESRTLTFEAEGVIKTSDGREIRFELKLELSWQYSKTSIQPSEAMRRFYPLVLNFNGTAAQLSDLTFAFDLNDDGEVENISPLQPGSTLPASDKDEDSEDQPGTLSARGIGALLLHTPGTPFVKAEDSRMPGSMLQLDLIA